MPDVMAPAVWERGWSVEAHVGHTRGEHRHHPEVLVHSRIPLQMGGEYATFTNRVEGTPTVVVNRRPTSLSRRCYSTSAQRLRDETRLTRSHLICLRVPRQGAVAMLAIICVWEQ